MAGEESRRPQFVRIPEFLGLAAGEVHNPRLGLGRDRGLLAGPGSIIERRHRAIGQRSLRRGRASLTMVARVAVRSVSTARLASSGSRPCALAALATFL